MTDVTTAAFVPRWYHRIPLLGQMARDLQRDFEGHIGYVVLMLVSLFGIALLTWGLPGLVMMALGLVPVMFGLIIAITWG